MNTMDYTDNSTITTVHTLEDVNQFHVSGSYEKENQPSVPLMFSSERLGAVPENKTFSCERKTVENKIAELGLSSIDSAGGVKRLAIIDPLQSLNGRSRLAKRLFVSPLQKAMSNRKKRSFGTNVNTDYSHDNERASKKMMVTRETSRATNGSNQYQHDQPENYTNHNFSMKERIDFLCGKIPTYGMTSTKLLVDIEFDIFAEEVNKVQGVDESKIFDSCPEVVAKIKSFICTFKLIDRSHLYRSFGVHGNSFNSFILSQNQEKCNNPTYLKAYIFFEKLRLYLGEPKSAARRFNEVHYPDGFATKKHSSRKNQMMKSDNGESSTTTAFELC